MKSAGNGHGVMTELNGRAKFVPLGPFWPVKQNTGQYSQARPVIKKQPGLTWSARAGVAKEKDLSQSV